MMLSSVIIIFRKKIGQRQKGQVAGLERKKECPDLGTVIS